MLLLWALVSLPLHVKGLPLLQELGKEEESTVSHQHPARGTSVLSVQGAQSSRRVSAGIRAASAQVGCVCSGYTARSVWTSVGILSDHFHLNPASALFRSLSAQIYWYSHSWNRGALQPHILWGKETPTQNFIGNRILPWFSIWVLIPASPQGPWKSCTTPFRRNLKLKQACAGVQHIHIL